MFITINQFVFAASETFPLSPMTSIVRNVDLQQNDRFWGSFAVKNVQTWKNAFGETQSYDVSVTVKDPKGQVVLSYTKTNGNSFDYTAFYSGVYTNHFYCGLSIAPPSGIENPEVDLNYNVVSSSQPSTLREADLLIHNLLYWQMIPILAGTVISVIIALTYFVMKKKTN